MGRDESFPIRVYVAGSIAATLEEQSWRREWKKWLESLDLGLVVLDPVIEKDGRTYKEPHDEIVAYVVTTVRILVESCYVLLIVHDLEKFSVDTWVEMAWAFNKGLYIILFVTNPDYPEKRTIRCAFRRRMCDEIIYNDREELRRV
ncbi:unnamed protein product, partial [marine sediment metagenome]